MRARRLAIPEVLALEPEVHGDERGFFMETFNTARAKALGLPEVFLQDNHSGSRGGVLRGLHYQLERAQGKLVRVVRGEVFDVAVDIRQGSPWFGRWVGERLSEANRRMVYVPPGFAHGFLVLGEWAEVCYKCTELYRPGDERGIRWDDPELGIEWPGEVELVSAKDRGWPSLREAELPEHAGGLAPEVSG